MMTPPTPTWTQETLLPPDAVEITLRLGFVGQASHGQWQLEVRNATDGQLLSMLSCPHFHVRETPDVLVRLLTEAASAVETHVVPF